VVLGDSRGDRVGTEQKRMVSLFIVLFHQLFAVPFMCVMFVCGMMGWMSPELDVLDMLVGWGPGGWFWMI